MLEIKARIAQLVEQLAFNQLVLGSSPSPRTSLTLSCLLFLRSKLQPETATVSIKVNKDS